jgi:hypothetical protein
MPAYLRLTQLVAGVTADTSEAIFSTQVVPYLIDVWLTDYERFAGETDIVETTVSSFSYLFDIAAERLIAAWGISKGRHGAPRDRSRMAGHPLSTGPLYHRGHAIPHTLGGPTDINLVPQRGSVNVGPFRALERQAVATPGSLYFTYWMYRRLADQTPVSVEQGLLAPGRPPDIRTHPN